MFRFSRKSLSTLVLADASGTSVSGATQSAITAAGKFGDPVTVLVAGHNISEAAAHAAKLQGVSKVVKVDAPHYAHGIADNTANLLVELRKAGGYKRVVAPHSAVGKQVLPRAAAIEGVAATADVLSVEADGSFSRPFYAGNAIADGKNSSGPFYVTVRPTAFDKAAEGGSASVEDGPAVADLGMSEFVKIDLPDSDKVDLGAAKSVVAGGRGLKSGDNFKLLDDLAKKLPNCAVGATRAVVDAGMCSYDMQIGQTGKIVAPDLYLGVGLSGAIQHLAGMKDSKVIVAINNDPEAPIFSVADWSLEEDLFKAVPALTAAI